DPRSEAQARNVARSARRRDRAAEKSRGARTAPNARPVTSAVPPPPHAALRDDVRLLGTLLGDTLRAREGDERFAQIERVRAMAKSAHEGDRGGFDQLADLLRDLPLASAVPIARAF